MSNYLKTAFLITARLKSSRLPKKIILDVVGKPLLIHMLDRIKQASHIDKIIICTSTNSQDDMIAEIAVKEGVSCYRGSEDDVLVRLYEAAQEYKVEYFVNITADCPTVDPFFIDNLVSEYQKTKADLIMYRKLPAGQRPYLINVDALKKVCEIKNETETEVWGDYFIKSGLFHIYDIEVDGKYRHPELRTSLDYPEDYEFIKKVFEELYKPQEIFSLLDIIELVRKKPELLSINSHCSMLSIEHIAHTAASVKYRIGNSFS